MAGKLSTKSFYGIAVVLFFGWLSDTAVAAEPSIKKVIKKKKKKSTQEVKRQEEKQVRSTATTSKSVVIKKKKKRITAKAIVAHKHKAAHADEWVIYVPVTGQKGAECGYHALYNAWAKYNEFSGQPKPSLSKNLKEWKANVAHRRQDEDDDQWINDAEISDLAGAFVTMPRADYSIIPDIEQIEETPYLNDISGIIRQIRSGAKPLHAFVLGNMRHNRLPDSPVGGTRGHWIAVVVRREGGRLRYYVLDSLNGKPRAVVNTLRRLLEEVNVDDFEFRATVGRDTNEATNDVERNRYDHALGLITHLVNLAQSTGSLNNKMFAAERTNILNALQAISWLGNDAQQKWARALLKQINQ